MAVISRISRTWFLHRSGIHKPRKHHEVKIELHLLEALKMKRMESESVLKRIRMPVLS